MVTTNNIDRERKERCTQCGELKPASQFNRARRNKHRAGRRYDCRECEKSLMDASRRNERLVELAELGRLLKLPPCHPDHIQFMQRYQYFHRIAQREPEFPHPLPGESVLNARRRWLLIRTEQQPSQTQEAPTMEASSSLTDAELAHQLAAYEYTLKRARKRSSQLSEHLQALQAEVRRRALAELARLPHAEAPHE